MDISTPTLSRRRSNESIEPGSEMLMHVFHELLTSEQSYVGYLRTLYEVFARPLLELSFETLGKKIEICIFDEQINSKPVVVEIPKTQLDRHLVEFLGQVETIYHVNQAFCEDLQERFFSDSEEMVFSDLFKKFSGLFRLYAKYAQNFNVAATEFSTNSKTFQDYVLGCQAHPAFSGQSVSSLLIMPIQRLPRYALFLKEIRKSTQGIHKIEVEKASEEITKVIADINKTVL